MSENDCNDGTGNEVQIMVYLENSLDDDVMNANSEVYLQSLCILQSELSKSKQDQTNPNFELYPNPTNQSFHLNILDVTKGVALVEVFDQFGKAIEKFNLDEQHRKINFGNLYPSALYFLRISIQNQTECIKLIKVSK